MAPRSFSRSAGKHDSDYLVRAYYSFRSAHHIYFALEFMPGGDLSSMLEECGCISESHTSFYLSEVLMGMHYLHSQHILHRDIKPSNVLISASGHIKVTPAAAADSYPQRMATVTPAQPIEIRRAPKGDREEWRAQ